jgi:hypothetical protein
VHTVGNGHKSANGPSGTRTINQAELRDSNADFGGSLYFYLRPSFSSCGFDFCLTGEMSVLDIAMPGREAQLVHCIPDFLRGRPEHHRPVCRPSPVPILSRKNKELVKKLQEITGVGGQQGWWCLGCLNRDTAYFFFYLRDSLCVKRSANSAASAALKILKLSQHPQVIPQIEVIKIEVITYQTLADSIKPLV